MSPNAAQTGFGAGTHDGVITKLTSDLGSLVWSTFLGGVNADAVSSLEADQTTIGPVILTGLDPLFVAAPNPGPDGAWETVDDDFNGLVLQSTSPAIDKGVAQYVATNGEPIPPYPITGFSGAAPDLGWREFGTPIFMSPTLTPVASFTPASTATPVTLTPVLTFTPPPTASATMTPTATVIATIPVQVTVQSVTRNTALANTPVV